MTYFVVTNERMLAEYHKISYSLVVILELNNVSEIQYKKIMMIDNK